MNLRYAFTGRAVLTAQKKLLGLPEKKKRTAPSRSSFLFERVSLRNPYGCSGNLARRLLF
jgi:hypothetical protein